MTQPVDIEALRQLMERATAGSWEVVPYGDGDSLVIHDARGDWRVCFMATPGSNGDMSSIRANAATIVALRNNAEALLTELEALRAERGRIVEAGEYLITLLGKAVRNEPIRDMAEAIGAFRAALKDQPQ